MHGAFAKKSLKLIRLIYVCPSISQDARTFHIGCSFHIFMEIVYSYIVVDSLATPLII